MSKTKTKTDASIVKVRSSTDGRKIYKVNVEKQTCECLGFIYRRECKHLKLVNNL